MRGKSRTWGVQAKGKHHHIFFHLHAVLLILIRTTDSCRKCRESYFVFQLWGQEYSVTGMKQPKKYEMRAKIRKYDLYTTLQTTLRLQTTAVDIYLCTRDSYYYVRYYKERLHFITEITWSLHFRP